MLVWTGISQIDNSTPIGLFVTGNSRNAKTGNMIQTWIMRLDIEPHSAVKDGSDSAICGECPYRAGSGCYVTTHQAPLSVWRAHKGKAIASMRDISQRFFGTPLRIGSYGDPCAVPLNVWHTLLRLVNAPYHTGYSHQWRAFPEFRSLLMASVDSVHEADRARAAGWRTFRVTPWDRLDLERGEIECPADSRGIQCIDCGLCDGARMGGDKRKSIAIKAHGAKAHKVGAQ